MPWGIAYEQAQLSDHPQYRGFANCLEKRVISFLADRRIPVVLFKSHRSSEKCIKKRRKSLYHKDFGVISFSAARYKKKSTPCGCSSFCRWDLNRATSEGGSGLGARPPPGAGGGSATREKIRRAGGGVTPRPARLYIFDRAMKNPTSATKETGGTFRCLLFLSL